MGDVSCGYGISGDLVYSRSGTSIRDFPLRRERRALRKGDGGVDKNNGCKMMSTLKVSVVVAAFNAEETVESLVQSLLNLDYPDHEVIVVNDGSTDNTRGILQKYPIILIDQENRGASAARNRGLMRASGEIVAYTDSDTVVDRGWLKELVKHFEDRHVRISFTSL